MVAVNSKDFGKYLSEAQSWETNRLLSVILPPYFRTRTIRNVASARSEQAAVGQRDAA